MFRNLHKVQAGRGVNSPGFPEIPEAVFEELLVNALVYRDYLVSAPIRIFVIDNRCDRGWASSMESLLAESLRRYLDSHQEAMTEQFTEEDVEWGLHGQD